MSYTTWCPIATTMVRLSVRLMASHDKTLVVDLGLSISLTPSVGTSSLGMECTFDTSFAMPTLPTSAIASFETIVDHIPQENTMKMHEDLAHLQDSVSIENISNIVIPAIDSTHHMMESDEGLEFV